MADSDDQQLPLVWEKARVMSVIAATLAVPILVAYLGNSLSKAQKQDELAARYVELAVGILKAEPTNETKALRGWAISVVNHFSQIPLSKEAQDELRFRAFEKDVRQVQSIVDSVLKEIQPKGAASTYQPAGSSPTPTGGLGIPAR